MLEITIPCGELYDEVNNRFIEINKEQTLQLEHSLVSLSKWESKWCKPFLSKSNKTNEELLDYIKCMTITQNVDPKVYLFLTESNINQINKYIEAPMTATTFSDKNDKNKPSREIVTSEIIYYWMIALQIPIKFEKWHLNRLLTLIKVCNVKNEPPKKMKTRDALSHHRAINDARRKRLNTKG